MIAIINYGSGNIAAIANIYKQLRIPYLICDQASDLAQAERYILPGVGAFDATMQHLASSGMLDVLVQEVVGHGKKVLGICVGMQILAESSEEGSLSGLGWIAGKVKKIDASRLVASPRLPHMGWNSIHLQADNPLFRGIDVERGFYFLHSYYFAASDPASVLATVSYGDELPCAVGRGNVYGLQFHPEKSHSNGMAIFRNFAEI
ncbi:MAG TPA: imidazole glycerol phosphate synthase subunit HisH [Accumulibacter sp.]|uniref:imidazole glycerol phosphate synthase subunit HisH n=1 Tax=Accumulibacter sp. TaxID=2053492 RepID=UPI002634BA3D|nr:imidazole glycerol phosphate synthase subunit HisH [Accumulibacter sp.]MDS4056680.1 imidazole glycerol phosphate synthase subunit HisH [Accumulibacter sp.]HMV05622.1 imidazole glycerol phosphate synthase subunit HisH [Accumulibacter sp.]HMW63265.1 imidazole glycerol phosphate synthase subunit HisH [Accumulibacter sp.]HMW79224.1 imidazole glycerol phosphate synthase subunit HisH [Accumulibacter sp.]HMX67389.1 imidazole glycerol phosphate synthase subunit HisH [Accumulibacter sp.]